MKVLDFINTFIGQYQVMIFIFLFAFAQNLKFRNNGKIIFGILAPIYVLLPFIVEQCSNISIYSFLTIGWYSFSFILYFAIGIILFYFSFNVSIKETIYFGLISYLLQNLTVNIVYLPTLIFNLNQTMRIIVSLILSLVSYISHFFYFEKKIKKNLLLSDSGFYLLGFIAASLIFINILSQYWTEKVYRQLINEEITPTILANNIYATLLIAMVDLLLIFIQVGFFQNRILKRDNEVLENIQKESQLQKKMHEQSMEDINAKCHDLKYIIQLYEHYHDTKYLDDINKSIKSYENIALTDNAIIDTIITNKKKICDENNIYFTFQIDGNDYKSFDNADLYITFSNLLDNAIEANKKTNDTTKRFIHLYSKKQENILKLEIVNYNPTPTIIKNGKPITTKKDKKSHGYGTKSIINFVEKYNGYITFEQNNNYFIVTIIFTNISK